MRLHKSLEHTDGLILESHLIIIHPDLTRWRDEAKGDGSRYFDTLREDLTTRAVGFDGRKFAL